MVKCSNTDWSMFEIYRYGGGVLRYHDLIKVNFDDNNNVLYDWSTLQSRAMMSLYV